MKKIVVTILLLFLVISATPIRASAAGGFVGSKESNVYHVPSCHYVNRILKKNEIWFKTREAADKKGYRGCYVCHAAYIGEDFYYGKTGLYTSNDIAIQNQLEQEYSQGYKDAEAEANKKIEKLENEHKEKLKEEKESSRKTVFYVFVVTSAVFIVIIICIKRSNKSVCSSSNNFNKTIESKETKSATKQTVVETVYTQSKKVTSSAMLNSSFIKKAEYEDRVLYLYFCDGSAYAYYNTTKKVYDELIKSTSAGKYYNEKIKGFYPEAPYHNFSN